MCMHIFAGMSVEVRGQPPMSSLSMLCLVVFIQGHLLLAKLAQGASGICCLSLSSAGIVTMRPHAWQSQDFWDWNLGVHASTTSSWPTETPPPPQLSLLRTFKAIFINKIFIINAIKVVSWVGVFSLLIYMEFLHQLFITKERTIFL